MFGKVLELRTTKQNVKAMLTREAKQQVDLHISDYKDELGNEDFIYENTRMTLIRRVVRTVERWIDTVKRKVGSGHRNYYQA